MENKNACAGCHHELDLGVDAFKVEQGVIGMRGFVPLEKPQLFCSEKCLVDYFDLTDLPKYPKRIP